MNHNLQSEISQVFRLGLTTAMILSLPKPQVSNWPLGFENNLQLSLSFEEDFDAPLSDAFLFSSLLLPTFSTGKILQPLKVLFATTSVTFLLKKIIARERPYLIQNPASEGSDRMESFPSGHTSAAFALATTLCIENKTLCPLGYTFATLTAFFRIKGNRHFLTDCLAGALLGTSIALLLPKNVTLVPEPEGLKISAIFPF